MGAACAGQTGVDPVAEDAGQIQGHALGERQIPGEMSRTRNVQALYDQSWKLVHGEKSRLPTAIS